MPRTARLRDKRRKPGSAESQGYRGSEDTNVALPRDVIGKPIHFYRRCSLNQCDLYTRSDSLIRVVSRESGALYVLATRSRCHDDVSAKSLVTALSHSND